MGGGGPKSYPLAEVEYPNTLKRKFLVYRFVVGSKFAISVTCNRIQKRWNYLARGVMHCVGRMRSIAACKNYQLLWQDMKKKLWVRKNAL